MPETIAQLDLRPATLDDAVLVADLESLRDPNEPRDPVLLRYGWQMADEMERGVRHIAVRDGEALAFVGASHELWPANEKRYGILRVRLRQDLWSEPLYAQLVQTAEDWLREERAVTSVARVRQDYGDECVALERLGYREDRRMRISELDLISRGGEILAVRDECRRRMGAQGVEVLALSDNRDPDKHRKLYEMVTDSEEDIPRTVPWRVRTFEQWMRFWFGNPGIREDIFWIARQGGDIVGCSVLDTPVVRGVPWTAYTATSRAVRGRGIARALKYESIGQAIESGYQRVRTANDADNPAILRINEQMGYRLVAPLLELHRELSP